MTTIYFATNRKPNRVTNPDDFTGEFSQDGLANLRFGKAEVTGSGFNQIEIEVARENLRATRPVLGSQFIFQEAQQRVQEGKLDTVILLHGFNVSFKDGLRGAAELERELTRANAADKGDPLKLNMVLFSWPSDASLLLTSASNAQTAIAYKNDRLDASASGVAFARAFLKLADYLNAVASEQKCEQRLHLVAHSMGNYVLRHALQEVRAQVGERLPRLFDQTLLMAADEDDDSFEFDYKLMYLPRLTRRTNVYFNRNDIALWASDTFKGNPSRLGTDGPLHPREVPRNVYPIDCTQVVAESSKGSKEHGYYINVPRVVTDMRRVLRNEIPDEILGRKFIFETNRYRLLPDANAPQQR
jgi:esterase/lipase superfamily enzyme